MANKREIECARKSLESKLEDAENKEKKLKEKIVFGRSVTANSSSDDPGQKIVPSPYIFPVRIGSLIFKSIIHFPNIAIRKHEKHQIKKKIKKLDNGAIKIKLPEKKDLQSLWELHGLEDFLYSSELRLRLLKSWIDVLYGEDTTRKLKLDDKLKGFKGFFEDVNKPYYEGEEDACHYYFGDPVSFTIEMISEKLPEYT